MSIEQELPKDETPVSPQPAQEPAHAAPAPLSSSMDDELQREVDDALGGMSIEELMEGEKKASKRSASGVQRGEVVAINGDDIFVELGGKSQGLLPALQFEGQALPKIGDVVEVVIEGYDANDGLLMLSRQGAVMAAAWETMSEGQMLEGRVTGLNKGGLELVIDGIKAFMPLSQMDVYRVPDASIFLNQKMKVQVVEIDREDRRVIVSRRALLELEAAEKRETAWKDIAEGQKFSGRVKTIMPYGAFVDIGNGIDGLLHVKDMSHGRVEDPRTIVKEGDQIEVLVLKADKEARKLALGLKQTLPDPWTGADVKWPADTVATGRVTRLADFGAFVELEPGVEGLVPMGEMSFERRVARAEEICKAGDLIKVRVLSVDLERKRISLSIKRVGDDPWMGASARWPEGSVVTGIVKRLADFGAFVEITGGVEGLVHISELKNEHVRAVGDAVEVGQTVQAKVLSVDEDKRRISLSIKQTQAAPAAQTGGAESVVEPEFQSSLPAIRKRKKPLKGGLD